jgi:Ni,Fe-hydrogenase III large subunit
VIAEPALSLRLAIAHGRVVEVTVETTRAARATTLLSGRAPQDAVRLAALLCPVCGVAHGVACARAIGAALGDAPDPRLEAARDLACLGEAAASHLWQLAIPWREAAGLPPESGGVRAARRALATLCEAVLGNEPASGARQAESHDRAIGAIAELVALLRLLTEGEVSLLTSVAGAGLAPFGAARTRTVADLDVRAIGELLAAGPDFAEHPEVDGAPVDVSAYARHRASEEVTRAETGAGGGLLARLVARRVEARATLGRLADAMESLERREQDARTPPRAARLSDGGAGSAETARGPLVYWARATSTNVEDVRAVAPTDWTFHPRGVLREALLGVAASPSLAHDAAWLVLALDPCVPWTIEVTDA